MFKKILFILFPVLIQAQLISVKSLPVVTGDQFFIFPSQNITMGGINIAVDDPWQDPFINPAKGAHIDRTYLFVQPTFYTIEKNLGGARTFPVSVFTRYKDWFAVFSGSFQQLEAANTSNNTFFTSQPFGPADRYADNKYAYAAVGLKLPAKGFSVGGSVFWADINAIGGVDLLYNNSVKIQQDGEIREFRGGLYYRDETSSFEAVGLYNNFDMLHQVSYWEWPPLEDGMQLRVDENPDHTNTYGIHLKYREKFDENGPSIGAMFTYNWKTHPKIPNYEIMNIPRDPGNTWAYNFGIGVGKESENLIMGLDFIFEPLWSNTWAKAAEEIDLGDGRKILPGQRTIENNFTFNNFIISAGLSRVFSIYELSAGLSVYSRSYTLDQYDNIQQSVRSQEESWTEKTLSWGVLLHFNRFDLKYSGRAISGSGIPSVQSNMIWFDSNLKMEAGDFIAAPSGKLDIKERVSYTNQFLIQVPLSFGLTE